MQLRLLASLSDKQFLDAVHKIRKPLADVLYLKESTKTPQKLRQKLVIINQCFSVISKFIIRVPKFSEFLVRHINDYRKYKKAAMLDISAKDLSSLFNRTIWVCNRYFRHLPEDAKDYEHLYHTMLTSSPERGGPRRSISKEELEFCQAPLSIYHKKELDQSKLISIKRNFIGEEN